jgi:hypothetical protein
VREKGTGKPLAGINVSCGRSWAKSDAEGHYQIDGPRKRNEYTVTAYGVPYFDVTKSNVADRPGFEPVKVDFELERGLAISGHVLDKLTGKPVRATITYLSFSDNPHLKQVSGLDAGGSTKEDGSFSFTALPGPGVLAVIANQDDYVKTAPSPGWKVVPSINWIPNLAHAFIRIDPSENDPKSTLFEIRLEQAASLSVNVIGPNGKPYSGYYVAGQTGSARDNMSWMVPKSSPTFTVRGLDKSRPRGVVLLSKDSKLGKYQEVHGDDAGPRQVKLEPLSSVSGRVLDADGRPLAGVHVQVVLRRKAEDLERLPVQLIVSGSWVKNLEPDTKTDSDGRFRLDGLLPGLPYALAVSDDERELYRENKLALPEAGTNRDLGDLKSK